MTENWYAITTERVELREERLCVRREPDRIRRAAWSKEEQEAVLVRMHAYGRSRVASETADDRQARLQQFVLNSWRD